MDIQDILRKYIANEFMHDFDHKVLDVDTPLIEQGVIDSMGLVKLVLFIEDRFKILIPEEDIEIENFRTVKALSEFISQKIPAV